MSNPNKQKGSEYERSIVRYLTLQGFDVERTRVGWADDRGDIHGITHPVLGNFTVECKNHKTLTLSQWLTELEREREANGGGLGAVVHKRQRVTDSEEQYATLPLWMLVQLLVAAGYK